MGDAAKGIKAFREGLKGEEPPAAPSRRRSPSRSRTPMDKEPIVR